MVKPSSRRPWEIEVRQPGTERWRYMDCCEDEETARARLLLMRHRSGEAEFRVINRGQESP
jgi:hypothetical protein